MNTSETLELVQELSKEAENFKPVVAEAVDALLLFGPEVSKLFESITDGLADLKMRMIDRFKSRGYTKAEAITMTLDTFQTLVKCTNKANK